MKDKVKELGLHLTVLLHKAGADDQAYEEIIGSLERARKRTEKAPPQPAEELPEEPQETKRTLDTADMRLLLVGTS